MENFGVVGVGRIGRKVIRRSWDLIWKYLLMMCSTKTLAQKCNFPTYHWKIATGKRFYYSAYSSYSGNQGFIEGKNFL